MQVNSGEPRDESSSNTEPSQSANASRFQPWRFGLRTFLLSMTILPLLFYWGWNYYLEDVPIAWEPFSQQALDGHLSEGRVVLIDVRADWDMTSKYLRHTVIESPEVRRVIRLSGVAALDADFTAPSPAIAAFTRSQCLCNGFTGLVILSKESKGVPAEILTSMFSKADLLNALHAANKP